MVLSFWEEKESKHVSIAPGVAAIFSYFKMLRVHMHWIKPNEQERTVNKGKKTHACDT